MRRRARLSPAARLATARLEFSNDRRFTRTLLLVAVAAVVLAAGAIARQSYLEVQASGTTARALAQQNAELRDDVARTRTELELERSTRAALARQVAQLNEEKRDLERRLAFFNAQDARQGRTR
ncbi:MAG TPA: hypothetical protein VNS57_05445 [Steroidobacteraceae bacterium]|nr:hypothetical protein [Steroidobacteraceae bacterium]